MLIVPPRKAHPVEGWCRDSQYARQLERVNPTTSSHVVAVTQNSIRMEPHRAYHVENAYIIGVLSLLETIQGCAFLLEVLQQLVFLLLLELDSRYD